ncbi:MAG: DUF975 family protein [Lachnospiraceae bacterium]|nr:DUF975 family protein [Lachnospiraceae bacterium]
MTDQTTGWNLKEIRKTSWNTVFCKGAKPWLILVTVCFLFAFLGASNSSQASVVNSVDSLTGGEKDLLPHNIDYLKDYLANSSLAETFPFLRSETVLSMIDSLSRSVTWIVRLLALNQAYYERNPGEVLVNIFLAVLLTAAVHFLFENVIVIGQCRFAMENRQQKAVRFRRILSPFHKNNLGNLIRVSLLYHGTLLLWGFTIIGGIYKAYQYRMVPYILAENPAVRWKDAKKLSAEMTRGYKWKMFCAELSYLYMWLLRIIPVVGLLTAVPLQTQLVAEFYFRLRKNAADEKGLLIEDAFALPAFVAGEREDDFLPAYRLADINMKPAHPEEKRRFPYNIREIIVMFFAFCLVGYLWEVGLHLVEDHMFVNRGTMYGPWLPIYGVGGVSIILLLDRFKKKPVRTFFIAVLLCAVLEYLTSFLLDYLFNSSYWDYKTMFMNINGRICLAGLLAFGIGGMAGVYLVGPAISRSLSHASKKTQWIICAVLCLAFAADLICCMIFGFNAGSGVGGNI